VRPATTIFPSVWIATASADSELGLPKLKFVVPTELKLKSRCPPPAFANEAAKMMVSDKATAPLNQPDSDLDTVIFRNIFLSS
jgi:hypothetical protein